MLSSRITRQIQQLCDNIFSSIVLTAYIVGYGDPISIIAQPKMPHFSWTCICIQRMHMVHEYTDSQIRYPWRLMHTHSIHTQYKQLRVYTVSICYMGSYI